MTATGRVVILNGTSSSGKTTLVAQFRARRAAAGGCWLTTGIDDYIARLPPEWMGLPGHDSPRIRDGMRLERVDPTRIDVRKGPVWERLARAYRRTVAAWAEQGFDVIVDEVVFDAGTVDDWHVALDGLDVLWVGVQCDTDVAVERERARGDRFIGLVRGQVDIVHRHTTYDLELDTTSRAPEELVAELERAVDAATMKR